MSKYMDGAVDLPQDAEDAESRGYDVSDFLYREKDDSNGPAGSCCGIENSKYAKNFNQLVRLIKLNHMAFRQTEKGEDRLPEIHPTIKRKYTVGDVIYSRCSHRPYYHEDDVDAWLPAGGKAVLASFGGPQDIVLDYIDSKGRVQRSSASWGTFSHAPYANAVLEGDLIVQSRIG